MKKLSIFAVVIAAMAFAACGGNKSEKAPEAADSLKSFEQSQVEQKIKVELDSLAAEIGKMKQVPFLTKGENGYKLSDQEKQAKPEYLLDPAVAENATTLAEKYRMVSALTVDKAIAELYDMPVDAYQNAITKLVADINDPSFKAIEDGENLYETSQKLYDAMNENGRINQFWQVVGASLVEEVYALSQNTDKFISAFTDETASTVTYRIVLLNEAIGRLAQYDSEFEPVAKAVDALSPLNAINIEQLKEQLAQAKEKIAEARAALIK